MTRLRNQVTPWQAPTCAGKTRYETFAHAKRRARKARQAHDEALVPYHCLECGGFHYGTRTPSSGARQMRRRRRELQEEEGDE